MLRALARPSGGSAVAVSANFAVAGLGTDTGCSVRAPASINCIFGLRPTHGLINLKGIIPMNLDWDTVGPLARSVSDIAELLNVMAGPEDTAQATVNYVSGLYDLDLNEIGIGPLNLPRAEDSCDDGVYTLFQKALEHFGSAEANVIDPVNMPDRPAHSEFDWYDRFKFDLNQFLKEYADYAPYPNLTSIINSGLVHPRYVEKLQRYDSFQHSPENSPTGEERKAVKRIIQKSLLALMDKHELAALVFPTFTKPPILNGDYENSQPGSNNGVASELSFPAISVPMGFTNTGLPVGLQIMARPFDEKHLLQIAYQFEQITQHRRPPII